MMNLELLQLVDGEMQSVATVPLFEQDGKLIAECTAIADAVTVDGIRFPEGGEIQHCALTIPAGYTQIFKFRQPDQRTDEEIEQLMQE